VIGEKSHKVLNHEHVSKSDDPATQRHEKLGTQRAMHNFNEQNVNVNMWIHDRNGSVNKLIDSEQNVINQNDLGQVVEERHNSN
jgi:hypothetical protein